MKKIKKQIIAFFVIVSVIVQSAPVLAAVTVLSSDITSLPMSTPALNSVEQNAANAKSQMPKISMQFDKNTVQPGEKITATAITTGFITENKNLYFTWYLKHRGEENVNNWKIAAAKILARGNFENSGFNYSGSNQSGKGYLALPAWGLDRNDYGDDATKDLITAAENKNCYLQNFKTGRIYELTASESAFSCPGGGTLKCVSEGNLSCTYPDPAVPPGPDITEAKTVCMEGGSPNCVVTSVENFASSVTCPAGQTARCISGTTFASGSTNAQICSALGLGIVGNTCASLAQTAPTCTRTRSNDGNVCEHLFAKPTDTGDKSGDGKYDMDEEKFWGTNPSAKSTAANGAVDEANVIGLGVNQFSWTYQAGDEIGVVVEGESPVTTKHNDTTNIRTWGFSKNVCSAFEEKNDEANFYVEQGDGSSTGFLTMDDFDINDCLEENLIDPAVAGYGQLEVGISPTPQNPVNIPAEISNDGDIVDVSSFVNNVQNSSDFYYKWNIEVSRTGTENPGDDGWQDITSAFNDITPVEGIGNSNLSFKMNLSERLFPNSAGKDTKFVRVKLKASEANTNGVGRTGTATSILKVNLPDRGINVYGARVEGGKLLLDNSVPMCARENPCPVLKNEIIGVTISNTDAKYTQFNWTYDAERLSCDSNMSSQCTTGTPTAVAFFPVTGEEGSSFEVKLSAKTGSSAPSNEFTKSFVVISPKVFITTADEQKAWPKIIGYSKETNGDLLPMISDTVFQALTGTDAPFEAQFYPRWIEGRAKFQWTLNGEKNASFDNQKALTFRVSEPAGSVYNLGISAIYSQGAEQRIALQNIWGINLFDSREEAMESSIQTEVLNPDNIDGNSVASASPNMFFANLVSNLPGQTMFLLRITLTALALLFVTGVIFSLMPANGSFEKRD